MLGTVAKACIIGRSQQCLRTIWPREFCNKQLNPTGDIVSQCFDSSICSLWHQTTGDIVSQSIMLRLNSIGLNFKNSHWDTHMGGINMTAAFFTHKTSPEMCEMMTICSLIISVVYLIVWMVDGLSIVQLGYLNLEQVCENRYISMLYNFLFQINFLHLFRWCGLLWRFISPNTN